MGPPKYNLLQGSHQAPSVMGRILLHWVRGVVITDDHDVQREGPAHVSYGQI